MSIWTGTVDLGSLKRAVIFDSVTEIPISVPAFSDEAEAWRFVLFVQEMGMGDVRGLGGDTLTRLHGAWLKVREELRVQEQEEASHEGA